ncbi:EAL domain-containing protein [Hirschia maritima]|uniref:EAL domain-containing protein n=1 Tax=Hirschia maritima TaxID=1121961 RepID=UPI00035D9077|nr:EAL domain-containing protein [Hirschia maritima]
MTASTPFKVIANDNDLAPTRESKIRFAKIQDLKSGEVVGIDAQLETSFEESALFGFASGQPAHENAAQWLGDQIERIGSLAETENTADRPISIIAPLAALTHPDAPMAAEAGARRANICLQEIRIEFPDSAIYEAEDIAPAYIESFFSRGFRIGIDARQSWKSPFGAYMSSAVEAIRLNANTFKEMPSSVDRIENAYGSGAMLFVENAHWTDAEELAKVGIKYAVSPRLNG